MRGMLKRLRRPTGWWLVFWGTKRDQKQMEKIGIQLSNYGLTVEPWNYGCRPTDESASLIAGIIANKMNQCENLSPTDFEQIGDVANGSEDPIKKTIAAHGSCWRISWMTHPWTNHFNSTIVGLHYRNVASWKLSWNGTPLKDGGVVM
jgi:hypothetical protein